MSSRSHSIALAVLTTLGALGAQETYKPKSLPTGAEALTEAKVIAARFAFWREQLTAECRGRGTLGKQKDEDIERCIAFAAGRLADVKWEEGADDRAAANAVRLESRRTEDPVILLCIAERLAQADRRNRAIELVGQAERALAKKPATPIVGLVLQRIVFDLNTKNRRAEAASGAAARLFEMAIEVARAGGFGKDHERVWLHFLTTLLDTGGWPEQHVNLLTRMEKAAKEPQFALAVLRARHHVHVGWQARGTGYAAQVGEQAFDTFHTNLEAAKQIALRTHQRWPQHPEGASLMLDALGPSGVDKDQLRRWLDAAVSAQIDHDDAFTTYLHYTQPRWGGSAADLLKFGLECLATKRFDTSVPGYYRLAIHYQALDVREPLKLWARASVQKRLEELDLGYLAAAQDVYDTWIAQSNRVAALALGDRLPEAAELRERMQYAPTQKTLRTYGIDANWLDRKLRPHYQRYELPKIEPSTEFAAPAPGNPNDKAAARPLTDHPQAMTTAAWNKRFLLWLVERFDEHYRLHGRHEAAWDADAAKLVHEIGAVVGGPPSKEAIALAKKLVDAGCDDPLVRYVAARMIVFEDNDRAVEIVMEVLPTIDKTFSPAFRWWARQFLLTVARIPGRGEVDEALLADVARAGAAAAIDPMFAGEARRFYLICTRPDELLLQHPQAVDDDLVAHLARQKDTDPWIVHAVSGLSFATKARLLDADDPERAPALQQARAHLEKAHSLCPQFPEGAAGMVMVQALEGPGKETPRQWFDRALDAQIDYQPAFAAYVHSLASPAQVHAFAKECLSSGRFDSLVPMWYLWALSAASRGLPEPRSVWALPEIAPALEQLIAGYRSAASPSVHPDFLVAGRMVLAWAGGRYDDALAQWEKGVKVQPRWLRVVEFQDQELVEFELQWLAKKKAKADKAPTGVKPK